MTLLAKFLVVFELLTGTLAVADVPCNLSGLFDLVEMELSFVKTFLYFLTLISRSHFRFRSVEAICRGSLVLLEWKTRPSRLLLYREDRNKCLPSLN